MTDTADGATLQPFNFATMSGVYPGTRTQVWQRLRLIPLEGGAQSPCWALLLWYDEPPACVITRQIPDTARLDPTPLLRLQLPAVDNLHAQLTGGLETLGWRLYTCGACVHWQSSNAAAVGAPDAGQFTSDGLALGACALRRADGPMHALEAVPPALTAQSHLALGCAHWKQAGAPAAAAAMLPVVPLPKIAETTESKLKPLARLRLRLARRFSPRPPPPSLADMLTERSGVGAGTEPCGVCQGRIANLGALTVASPEGDKETFSVWRCRICHTLYLSDWVDRWERVDSLETEERIYRIAPVEAAEFLTLFASIHAGDHPERRNERTSQRTWIHAQLAQRTPLSHTIKQGR